MKLISNCCGARPLGEVDRFNTGRCSKCKEGAVFFSEDECCLECGEHRPDDERVKSGMKCGYCTNRKSNSYENERDTTRRLLEVGLTHFAKCHPIGAEVSK